MIELEPWLDAVASDAATPGGGAVVAVQGAHAVALLEMVCRLTRGLEPHAKALGEHRAALMQLAEEDMRAFGGVARAYRLPRETPEDKAARTDAIQRGLVDAMQVPLDTIARVEAVLRDSAQVASATNPNVASDAGIALTMLAATLDAALYNVRINARFLRDRSAGEAASSTANRACERAHEEAQCQRALLEPHMSR